MNNINVGKCRGCQRKDLHKMCPAHGTLYYMSGEPFTKEVESIYHRFSLFINVKLMRKTYFFSQEAHKGQKRRDGKDYFLGHVLPVAMIASEFCIDNAASLEDYVTIVASALLHDVVEDTSITLQDIENYFGNNIACTVDALTRRKEENYYQFINRIRPEKYAPFVKLFDLLHNTNDVSSKDSNSNKHALYLFSIEKLSRDLSINILDLEKTLSDNYSKDVLILDSILEFTEKQ
jgi:GTP pyrophosphokinase